MKAERTTEMGTDGKAVAQESPPNGGVLIGFDISYGEFVRTPTISAIRPIYLSTRGKAFGQVFGRAEGNVIHMEAKTGYAVGRIFWRDGPFAIGSITVTYMKLTPTGLDPKDSYESACYGGGDGTRDGTYIGGDDGEMIVGIYARAEAGKSITRLGGMLCKPMPAEKLNK